MRKESVQFSSVAQSCLTLCDPLNRNTPGLPVHHHLPEFTQTHVHQGSDAIQPSRISKSKNDTDMYSWSYGQQHLECFPPLWKKLEWFRKKSVFTKAERCNKIFAKNSLIGKIIISSETSYVEDKGKGLEVKEITLTIRIRKKIKKMEKLHLWQRPRKQEFYGLKPMV